MARNESFFHLFSIAVIFTAFYSATTASPWITKENIFDHARQCNNATHFSCPFHLTCCNKFTERCNEYESFNCINIEGPTFPLFPNGDGLLGCCRHVMSPTTFPSTPNSICENLFHVWKDLRKEVCHAALNLENLENRYHEARACHSDTHFYCIFSNKCCRKADQLCLENQGKCVTLPLLPPGDNFTQRVKDCCDYHEETKYRREKYACSSLLAIADVHEGVCTRLVQAMKVTQSTSAPKQKTPKEQTRRENGDGTSAVLPIVVAISMALSAVSLAVNTICLVKVLRIGNELLPIVKAHVDSESRGHHGSREGSTNNEIEESQERKPMLNGDIPNRHRGPSSPQGALADPDETYLKTTERDAEHEGPSSSRRMNRRTRSSSEKPGQSGTE